jgi:RHS repeat-associated protein
MSEQTTALPTSATTVYAATGGPMVLTHVDRGDVWMLLDGAGRNWFECDSRGFVETQSYDAMSRVVARTITQRGNTNSVVTSRIAYGDSLDLATSQALNLRGKISEVCDQSIWSCWNGNSFLGRAAAVTAAFSRSYQAADTGMPTVNIPTLDGTKPTSANLQQQSYTEAQQRYDAIGRVEEAVNATDNLIQLDYQLSGALNFVAIDGTTYLQNLSFNAKRQLLSIVKGSPISEGDSGLFTTLLRYDPKSSATKQCYTSTSASFVAGLSPSESDWIDGSDDVGCRQDMRYYFDPNGNVLTNQDAYPALVFGQTSASPAQADYGYNAIGQLLTASGMESPTSSPIDGTPQSNVAANALTLNTDGSGQLTPYQQFYYYDDGGNITAMNHFSSGTLNSSRSVAMKVSSGSNRAISTTYYQSLGGTDSTTEIDESFFTSNDLFDASGNQLKNPNLSSIAWDYRNQIAQISYPDPSGNGNTITEYYAYPSDGSTRTRKITINQNAAGLITQLDTVYYLGGVELRARYQQSDPNVSIGYDGETVSNATTVLDYTELRVKLGHAQSARILTGIVQSGGSQTVETYYSLGNNIDSCAAELNAQGAITNYQAFYPYGGTAFSAADSTGTSGSLGLKCLQYSGQEKDGTGLYYYGYRYYDAASFRWNKPDPAGSKGSGLNWYEMVGGNPITYRDSRGLMNSTISFDLDLSTTMGSTHSHGSYGGAFDPMMYFIAGTHVVAMGWLAYKACGKQIDVVKAFVGTVGSSVASNIAFEFWAANKPGPEASANYISAVATNGLHIFNSSAAEYVAQKYLGVFKPVKDSKTGTVVTAWDSWMDYATNWFASHITQAATDNTSLRALSALMVEHSFARGTVKAAILYIGYLGGGAKIVRFKSGGTLGQREVEFLLIGKNWKDEKNYYTIANDMGNRMSVALPTMGTDLFSVWLDGMTPHGVEAVRLTRYLFRWVNRGISTPFLKDHVVDHDKSCFKPKALPEPAQAQVQVQVAAPIVQPQQRQLQIVRVNRQADVALQRKNQALKTRLRNVKLRRSAYKKEAKAWKKEAQYWKEVAMANAYNDPVPGIQGSDPEIHDQEMQPLVLSQQMYNFRFGSSSSSSDAPRTHSPARVLDESD